MSSTCLNCEKDLRECRCAFRSGIVLQSVTQTGFGTLCLTTHGQLYELLHIDGRYVLRPLTLTVEAK